MKNKILFLVFLVFIISMVGCKKSTDSWYGKMDNIKYTNEKFGFSMETPKDWTAQEDIDEANIDNDGNTNLDNLDECCIFSMSAPSSNEAVKVNEKTLISEGLNIRAVKTKKSLEGYTNDIYKTELECKIENKVYDKVIGEKQVKVIENDYQIYYITESEDRTLVFYSCYANKSKDKVLKSFESLKFY